MPAKILKDFKAGSAESPLTMNATKSVMDVIMMDTPARRRVLAILRFDVILGLTWSATAVITYMSSAPIPRSKNGSKL